MTRCPCSTGLGYADCCGPLHDGSRTAPTAESLMRSRYSAFAVRDAAYLLASWHSSTRPGALDLDDDVRWTGLEIVSTSGGGMLAAQGTVGFRAHWAAGGHSGGQAELSRFSREGGRWVYLDGVPLR